jgi:hypothetical protein
MAKERGIGRPTRPSDWLLLTTMTLHNFSYVVTTMLEGAVTLVENHVRHRDDVETAWQNLTIDLETMEDTDASRRLPEA